MLRKSEGSLIYSASWPMVSEWAPCPAGRGGGGCTPNQAPARCDPPIAAIPAACHAARSSAPARAAPVASAARLTAPSPPDVRPAIRPAASCRLRSIAPRGSHCHCRACLTFWARRGPAEVNPKSRAPPLSISCPEVEWAPCFAGSFASARDFADALSGDLREG